MRRYRRKIDDCTGINQETRATCTVMIKIIISRETKRPITTNYAGQQMQREKATEIDNLTAYYVCL